MGDQLQLLRRRSGADTSFGTQTDGDTGGGLSDSLVDPLQAPTQQGDDEQQKGAKAKGHESPFLQRLRGMRQDVKENPDKPDDKGGGDPSKDEAKPDPATPSGGSSPSAPSGDAPGKGDPTKLWTKMSASIQKKIDG